MGTRKIQIIGGIPTRVNSTISNKTFPFPVENFCGPATHFQFQRMEPYYIALRDALARLGMEITLLGARNITERRVSFLAYVGDPENPKVVWRKYEGQASGAGTNLLYVNGRVCHMTSFLSMTPERQEELLEPCELRRWMLKESAPL